MSNAQSAEMVFTSNRADAPMPASPTSLTARTARLDLATPQGQAQGDLQTVLDRIEQLEFALAEAVLRGDGAPSDMDHLPPKLDDLSARLDAMARNLADLASRPAPKPAGLESITEQLSRISDRLDAAAASRADETAMIAARLTALEAGSETRFAPIEAALQALSSQVKDTISGLLPELERSAHAAAADRAEIKGLQTRLCDQIDALPQPVDPTDMLHSLAARLQDLPQPIDLTDDIKALTARMSGLADASTLGTLAEGINRTEAGVKAQIQTMMDRLATLEASLSARVAHISDTAETLANRPVPAPDIGPLRELTARHMVAQKTIADRHAAQIAQLADRFAKVEAGIKGLPDQASLTGLKAEIDGALEQGRQPLVTRMDALAGMLTTLANDVKLAHDLVPDVSLLTEPLMARMDRLDTTAEQRQRELAREVEEIGARPMPVTDLTPIRESFARLMVALQGMHQTREAADADILSEIRSLTDNLQSLPDRMEASADQRQRDVLREVESLASRPVPAPDLSPVRETMSRFMVALKTLEDNRAAAEAELAAKFELLAEQIDALPQAASADDLAKISASLVPLQAAMATTSEQVRNMADRPAPALDISTVRGAFSQQMVAISTWMKRQDVLQSAMSDLLETLVQQGAATEGQDELSEALKMMISANQFTARKQLEAAEARLSDQMSDIATAMGLPERPRDVASIAGDVSHICEEDQRLLDAVQELRQVIEAEAETGDTLQLQDQTRELRLALAETLASMQAGQASRI